MAGWFGGEVLLATREGDRQKWVVPRGGARSITTDSSETDRYHSSIVSLSLSLPFSHIQPYT